MILKPPSGEREILPEEKSNNPLGVLKKVKSPESPLSKVIENRSLNKGNSEGIRQPQKGGYGGKVGGFEDPAIVAMRSAGLQTTGRELVPVKEYAKKPEGELEERPSEVAKRTFEQHGLDFVYVATKIHQIIEGSEPFTQLKALEVVNKVLLKTEEEADEMKKLLEAARTPSVVINISSPYSPDVKSNLDILIPS